MGGEGVVASLKVDMEGSRQVTKAPPSEGA